MLVSENTQPNLEQFNNLVSLVSLNQRKIKEDNTTTALFNTVNCLKILGDSAASHEMILTEVTNKVNALQGDVTTLKADVTTLKADVGTLKADVGTLKADVGTLKADVTTLKADVGTLKADVGTLKADVGTLKADVTTLKADVETLKEDMSKMNKNMIEKFDSIPQIIQSTIKESLSKVSITITMIE